MAVLLAYALSGATTAVLAGDAVGDVVGRRCIEWRGDAVLFFAVGEIVNGFYIGRELFVRGDAHASHSDDGTLELVDADGGTLRIRDQALNHE